MTPFQIPEWKTLPTETEIVAAIVGTGGSADERVDAEAITRDLLLPAVRRTDLAAVRWSVRSMKRDYELTKQLESSNTFLRFAISDAIGRLESPAARLAKVRLKTLLWPGEPFPEDWESSAAIDPATVPSAAAILDRRMKEIEARYGERLPRVFADHPPSMGEAAFGEYRIVAQVRNQIHVALTGDYRITSESVYDVLSKRGVKTQRLDVDRPY